MKKIIHFFNRTFDQIRLSYTNLKSRYRRSVQFKFFPTGAGLYRGFFSVQ